MERRINWFTILWVKQTEKGQYFRAIFNSRFYRASVNPSWIWEDEAPWGMVWCEPTRRYSHSSWFSILLWYLCPCLSLPITIHSPQVMHACETDISDFTGVNQRRYQTWLLEGNDNTSWHELLCAFLHACMCVYACMCLRFPSLNIRSGESR